MTNITEFTIELLEKQGYQYIHAFAIKLYGNKRS